MTIVFILFTLEVTVTFAVQIILFPTTPPAAPTTFEHWNLLSPPTLSPMPPRQLRFHRDTCRIYRTVRLPSYETSAATVLKSVLPHTARADQNF